MTLIIFLVILSLLVLVHESGHFLAARAMGIKVEEFAFGLPFTRPLWSIKRGETIYAVYPILFGGFVRVYGEEGEVQEEKGRSFWDRGRKQRMVVLAAGVVMNVLLAVFAFGILYSAIGVPVGRENQVTILKIDPGSPAEKAGLVVDERVVAVEGKPVKNGDEFGRLMKSWAGIEVNLTVRRGKEMPLLEGIIEQTVEDRQIRLTPRINPPESQGPIGVAIGDFPYIRVAKPGFGSGWVAAVRVLGDWTFKVIDSLRGIGKSLSQGKAPQGISGPVGIYQLTDIVSKGGFWPICELVAVLSINLAVFNVLPIPALDGGRMFFVWLEWVRRKRISAELEQKINSWGMTLLLALLAIITLQDILKIQVVAQILDKFWKK